MIKKLLHFPITILFVIIIFVACMVPVPETPLSNLSLIDKWTHILMFFSLGIVFWTEYYHGRNDWKKLKLFIISVILPILMGGLIEIMQATLTTCRSGEFLDFVADSIGVAFGAVIGSLLLKYLFKKARKE